MKLFAMVSVLFVGMNALGADGPCVIPNRGYFRIHTDTAGLFGAFAHEHLIEAQQIEGCATIDPTDLTRSSVKLTFNTAGIRVVDPKESVETKSKIQKTMESEVLHVNEYRGITFESTGVERGSGVNALRVRGTLTIGKAKQAIAIPVTLAKLDDGTYRAKGEYQFKQTTFGIKPIKLAGGTVKVKDEVETEFELFLK